MDEPQNNQADLSEVPAQSELEIKLAEAEKKRDEYLGGWQRAKADYLNYKKEELTRLAEVGKYASEDLIRELITVLDNYNLALAAMEKAGQVEKGVYLIKTQLEDIFRKRNIERLSAAPGSTFDPSFMEAIAEVEGQGPPGSVADEIEAGYKLHEKVLRPVRVRLVKEKS